MVSGDWLAVLYQDLGEGGWGKKEERRKRNDGSFVATGGGRAYNLRGVQVTPRCPRTQTVSPHLAK